MPFPTRTIYSSTNNASPLSLNIGSPASGDLLICMVVGSGVDIPDLPAGYTSINTQSRSTPGSCGYRAFYKVCDGTEGATVSVTKTGSPTFFGGITYKVAAGTYTGTPEGTSSNTNSTSVDPPLLTPSWGLFDTLWIAGSYNASTVALVAEPSDVDSAYAGTLTNAANRLYTEHAEKTAASENPPAYTLQFAQGAIAFTVAIRGTAGGGGGSNAPRSMFYHLQGMR